MCSDNYILDLLIMLHNLAMKSIVNHILKSIVSEHISTALSSPSPALQSALQAERAPEQAAPPQRCMFRFSFFGSGHLTPAKKKKSGSCHIIPLSASQPGLVPAVPAALGERSRRPRVPARRALRAAAAPARVREAVLGLSLWPNTWAESPGGAGPRLGTSRVPESWCGCGGAAAALSRLF